MFQSLQPLQLSWIAENLAFDGKEQIKALRGKGADVVTQAFETSNFDEAVAARLQQIKERKKVNNAG